MQDAATLTEIWRGDYLESVHLGHAIVMNSNGEIVASWGDESAEILPRSSCKMLQALPLIESGAADKYGLGTEQLALACASHDGAGEHTERVETWLNTLEFAENDLRCGTQPPTDMKTRHALIKNDESPCQFHNNCSGKHAGFLTLRKHLSAGPEYVEIDHPVQQAALQAFEEMTEENSSGHAIDGCSAPNFATSITGLARAAAKMSDPDALSGARQKAARQLNDAMRQHPSLVAGQKRACTELMRAGNGRIVVKTGAEGVYLAILPDQKIGVALKITDGATRAAESAIAALLVRLGALDATHPDVLKRLCPPILNRRKMEVSQIRPADNFYSDGKALI